MLFKKICKGNRKQGTLRALSLALGVLVFSSTATAHAAELSDQTEALVISDETSAEDTEDIMVADDACTDDADDEFAANGTPDDDTVFMAKNISVVKEKKTFVFGPSKRKVASSDKLVSTNKVVKEVKPEETTPSHPYYSIQTKVGARALSPELQDHTYNMCVKYGIPQYYGLILAQMWCESAYNPNVVSSAKSYGLMQICSVNFSRLQSTLGLSNLHDPYQNIEAGVYMMAGYIAKYGDVQTALVCYHRGESAARRGMRQDSYSSHIVSLTSTLSAA